MNNTHELMEAVDDLLISHAMGWDIDGAVERLRAAKQRIDTADAVDQLNHDTLMSQMASDGQIQL